jgi:hypothetical protein
MQTRHRAAATALLLTATTGLAATGGVAHAAQTHHAAHHSSKLVVTIKTKASGLKLSESKIRPGNTVFKVKNAGGKGLIQVLRLKKGYDLGQAAADMGAGLGGGDVSAIRRVDKNVVFYGGIETPHKKGNVNMWAVKIDRPGTYYAVDFDTNQLQPFTVKGHRQHRWLPTQTGWINATPGPNGVGNVFKAGKHNAHKGWMSTTNKAHEPHFVDFEHVKKSTTKHDVAEAVQSPNAPSFLLKGAVNTAAISPGHTFLWAYHLPKGKYVTLCFWPSKVDGMPHAMMGMWLLTHLH